MRTKIISCRPTKQKPIDATEIQIMRNALLDLAFQFRGKKELLSGIKEIETLCDAILSNQSLSFKLIKTVTDGISSKTLKALSKASREFHYESPTQLQEFFVEHTNTPTTLRDFAKTITDPDVFLPNLKEKSLVVDLFDQLSNSINTDLAETIKLLDYGQNLLSNKMTIKSRQFSIFNNALRAFKNRAVEAISGEPFSSPIILSIISGADLKVPLLKDYQQAVNNIRHGRLDNAIENLTQLITKTKSNTKPSTDFPVSTLMMLGKLFEMTKTALQIVRGKQFPKTFTELQACFRLLQDKSLPEDQKKWLATLLKMNPSELFGELSSEKTATCAVAIFRCYDNPDLKDAIRLFLAKIKNPKQAAKQIVREGQPEQYTRLLTDLLTIELSANDDINILLRGESFTSKLCTHVTNEIASEYVLTVILPFITGLRANNGLEQLDITTASKKKASKKSQLIFLQTAKALLTLVLESTFPAKLIGIIKTSISDSNKRDSKPHQELTCANTIFLRFICPLLAMAGSKNLITKPSPSESKGLLNLSKFLQKMANLNTNESEEKLTFFIPLIRENIEKVRKFYSTLAI